MAEEEKELEGKEPEITSGDQGTSPRESQDPKKTTSSPDGQASVEELEVSPAPGAKDYTHPLLQGKSPEEIEQVVSTMEEAAREQNVELNRLHAEVKVQPTAPGPTEDKEEEDPYGDDFIGTRFKIFEKRLAAQLKETVAPLIASAGQNESVSVRERLTKKYRHFASLEPHIDKLLRDQGMDPAAATEGQLDMLYHTAVGLAAESGITLGGGDPSPESTPVIKGGEAPVVNIPQHRPSGAPLPDTEEKTPVRDLTENERIIAHAQFPHSKDPEGDYRALQDADETEIVEPGFSKAGWK